MFLDHGEDLVPFSFVFDGETEDLVVMEGDAFFLGKGGRNGKKKETQQQEDCPLHCFQLRNENKKSSKQIKREIDKYERKPPIEKAESNSFYSPLTSILNNLVMLSSVRFAFVLVSAPFFESCFR